ncbi:uncharacterized protein VTP21DRAFT_5392 [Calcarisporiella thermophila]|uniref:uncharacterized protein n=1 Tax=Calcarisporiella thermophila TaxID=911321 RepID=UPI00374417F1
MDSTSPPSTSPNKRKAPYDPAGYSNKAAKHRSDQTANAVAMHYNMRPEVGVERRKESNIYQLKCFNNWIKSVLIHRYARPGIHVLDMGCGKGGDLLKWDKARIAGYVGADVAEVSIRQAEERYRNLRRARFSAHFYALDCYTTPLTSVLRSPQTFHIVTMQFCMHYAFETEAKARMMLRNVTSNLARGGYFIGTIPDAYWIVKKLKSVEGLEIGNSIYSIRFDQRESFPLFGCRYNFHLEDAVDCPEYLVHFPTFQKLAREYGLTLMYKQRFHELYDDARRDPEFLSLLYRMGVIKTSPEPRGLSEEEWEAAGIYLSFAFKKE